MPGKVKEFINLSELAKRMGVARSTVDAAEQAGRITVDRTSGAPLVEWPKAGHDWEANKTRVNAVDSEGTAQGYQKARTKREKANAEKAVLDLETKKGNLLKKEEIEKEGFEVGRRIREAFETLPSRVAPNIAAKTDPHEVEIMLMAEVNQVLETLTDVRGYEL